MPTTWKLSATLNILLVFGLMLAVVILDASLQLGQFHGFVFALYMAYGSIAIGVGNLVWATVQYFSDNLSNAKLFVALGIIVAAVGLGIAYAGSYFFTT